MEMTHTQTLYGLYGSQISRKNAIGYCRKHKAHLTINSMKQHQCLKKGCFHLKRHEENPYWEERENLRLEKKNKKKLMF